MKEVPIINRLIEHCQDFLETVPMMVAGVH
jgi:hypothetical protein